MSSNGNELVVTPESYEPINIFMTLNGVQSFYKVKSIGRKANILKRSYFQKFRWFGLFLQVFATLGCDNFYT